jgi:hypothetical protein
VVGGYIRVRWEDVCREVGKLQFELRRGAKVIALPVTRTVVNGGGHGGAMASTYESVGEESGVDGT